MRIAHKIAAGVVGAATMLTFALPAATAGAAETQTITLNPWYQSDTFKGWGTSLAWYANATGHYALSDNAQAKQLADDFYDLLFSKDGLDLQTVRYNIGGGNASDTTDYLRPGAAVEGWWKANPEGDGHSDTLYGGTSTTYANKDAMLKAWNPDDEDSYDYVNADLSQRWWLQKLQDNKQVKNWEFFSNSAPYFMTNSGYVSGHWKGSTDDQLAGDGTEAADSDTNATVKFAKYLAHVTKYLKDTYGITPDTIEPLNEPNDCTNCWITQGSASNPSARQEGMSVKSSQQAHLIKALREALDAEGLTATEDGKQLVSAMDASNSLNFQREISGSIDNGNGYLKNASDWDTELGQFNTHGYGDQTYAQWIRDFAKAYGKPLMMSEFEGDLGSGGFDPYSFDRALNFAAQVNTQMRNYEPNSWVLWQPVEDYYNMEQDKAHGGENLNWGSIYIDFDCQVYTKQNGESVFASKRRVENLYGGVTDGKVSNDVPACTTQTNSKFNVFKNYTHFIQAGDHVIATDSNDATAAVRPSDKSLRLVVSNTSASDRATTVNLAGFGTIADDAVAKTYATTAAAKSVTVTVPAKSVTTIVVTGVSGVSETTTQIADGSSHPLLDKSGTRALTVADDGSLTLQQRSEDAADQQTFTFTQVPAAATRPSDRAYVISTKDGKVLTATGDDPTSGDAAAVTLADETLDKAKSDPAAIWILNSEDGQTFGLLNKKTVKTLDLDGAKAVAKRSTSAGSQAWRVNDVPEDSNCPAVKTPWASVTLGNDAGKVCQTSTTAKDYGFTITDGANGGAWTNKNEYTTVYRADALKAGDSLTATVSGFEAGGNSDARAGIVVRNDLSANGQNSAKGYAFLLLSKNGLFWQNDTDGNGYIDWEEGNKNTAFTSATVTGGTPVTIRVIRVDADTLEGFYQDADGKFVSVGTVDVKGAEDALDTGVVTEANNSKSGAVMTYTGVDLSSDETPVTPPADTTAPVFAGVDDVTVDYGADFDPLAGVTATDDVDGDVTKDIKVEGTVDTKTAGEYTLTYTVADKAGNTAKATRKVTVKEQQPEPQPVDKTQLNQAIAAAEGYKESDYTAESWSAFAEALKTAKKVSADESASAEQVKTVLQALKDAEGKLVKAEPEQPGKPGDNGKPTTPTVPTTPTNPKVDVTVSDNAGKQPGLSKTGASVAAFVAVAAALAAAAGVALAVRRRNAR
ncbi:immunoglobulin-like domain-containing protein [Bifidobacterium leontopitheci]|uniref:HYR domain-containing protein n=1 Tax=Bifidobacterium leontopitheci TaxID=2650774 RepID=A0A6I1GFI1_9BIFI|nr:immunoglobulin-like domain-containing protein [Bifidobacterium leontopitheci]KAB7790374.1 hypothetical protein F7D09_1130 [Bifidobacterium leontopitheci]